MSIFDSIVGVVERAIEEQRAIGNAAVGNIEVFNDSDIVVAIAQDAVNRELAALTRSGVLPSALRIVRTTAGKDYVFTLAAGETGVPRDPQGNATTACIDAAIQTAIAIPATGNLVTLLVHFTGGEAWLGESVGPLSSLKKYDIAGWVFGIPINLDLAAIAKADIGRSIQVPP